MKAISVSKKTLLISSFSILAVIMLIAGVYLLIINVNKSKPLYNVDKYPDVVNWCDSSISSSNLNIDCKALLLNIDTKEDGTSCFDVQVISNSNELKDLTVCEKGGALTYTNEVLGYKKLMPIDIVFSYSQDSNLLKKSYSFTNVSFKQIDESYIQNIVNEDIANLTEATINHNIKKVTLDDGITTNIVDSGNYTILNGVDFCISPSKLPIYITENNKDKYTIFYNNNLLTEDNYLNQEKETFQDNDTIIRNFFSCKSSELLNYSSYCTTSAIKNLSLIKTRTLALSATNINWENTTDALDLLYLKEVSLLYDKLFIINSPSLSVENLNSITSSLNTKNNLSSITLCSAYSLYKEYAKYNSEYENDANYINNLVTTNIKEISTASCDEIIANDEYNISISGLYLKIYYSNLASTNVLRIYNDCLNLDNVIK